MHPAATMPSSSPASPAPASPSPSPRAFANEPVWRQALDWFERANALAAREVRLALRSPRAWLLLSLYVSILGAVVLAQFPAGTSVEMWAGGSSSGYSSGMASSQRGLELLQTFSLAQFFGIWLLVPSLAVGALHQEREGQTLESLLLSPLSPLQIVWGKLCGVLAMTFVLLLGTLPLTSLCFLLGGVAPEDVALRFFGLLAWAMFCAGVGLYCAARTPSVTKATLQAYGLAMAGLMVSGVMLGPGVALASVGMIVWIMRQGASLVRAALRKTMRKPQAEPTAKDDTKINALTLMAMAIALSFGWTFLSSLHLSMVLITALLVFPYGIYVSQLAVNAAAHEIAKRPDPAPPKREARRDLQAAYQLFSSPDTVVYNRAGDGSVSHYPYAPASSTYKSATVTESKPTYGVQGFLSDKQNPIFARDLRHGVGGRASTLVRWAYCAVIATQLFLIAYLSNSYSSASDVSFLSGCVKGQVVLVMMACAWLGARAIAPEREAQTLAQLLTLPMPASRIISGKIASVLYFSLYVLLAGLPLLLMLPLTYMMSWGAALSTIALQCAWGLLAGSWGVFCSLHCGKVRRALVWSLGGVAFGLFGAALGHSALIAATSGGWIPGLDALNGVAQALSPLALAESGIRPVYGYASYQLSGTMHIRAVMPLSTMWFSVGTACAVAGLLLASSGRVFAKLAHRG